MSAYHQIPFRSPNAATLREMTSALDNRRDKVEYGDGRTIKTPIEGAAREGYLDALNHMPFSREYTDQVGQWQRNYESGRMWVAAIRSIGLTPADWSAGSRTPQAIINQLNRHFELTGSAAGTDSIKANQRPCPDPSRLHAIVPIVRRGRIVEIVT